MRTMIPIDNNSIHVITRIKVQDITLIRFPVDVQLPILLSAQRVALALTQGPAKWPLGTNVSKFTEN